MVLDRVDSIDRQRPICFAPLDFAVGEGLHALTERLAIAPLAIVLIAVGTGENSLPMLRIPVLLAIVPHAAGPGLHTGPVLPVLLPLSSVLTAADPGHNVLPVFLVPAPRAFALTTAGASFINSLPALIVAGTLAGVLIAAGQVISCGPGNPVFSPPAGVMTSSVGSGPEFSAHLAC